MEKLHEGERIAKVMARVGLCSRRDAELWIEHGRVAVNGETLASAARNVTEADRVTVDGKPLATRERTRLFLFHKPRGLVTTDRDPEGRATVFDYIAEKFPALPRLMSIGRLDINTEGLLLLTNDGGLARVLELPSTGWLRRYRARANGVTDQAKLDTLSRGVTLDGVDYAGVEARLDRVQGANVWISLGLREGKNREVKRLLEHLGLGVNRLIRLSYGPFQLGEMADGMVEEVKTRVLGDQLGEALAREANVDFDGPVIDRTPAPEPERRFSREGGPRARRPAESGEKSAKPERKSFASQEKAEPRKHVSALRGDRAKAEKGPRRRTERDATQDRKGRKVVVERVSNVQRAEPTGDTRNARRFREERGFNGEQKIKEAGPKTSGAGRQREGRAEKPAGETGAAKTFRRDAFPRDGRAGGNGERPRGPGRSVGDKPAGGKDFRPRGEGRSFGDKPAGGRPSAGGKPSAGGRSFGDRPSGGKTSGGKPFGAKPSGGKSLGGKSSGPRKPRGK
ncbi:pseudouridine synthase [uncultured Rhodoblastus sp.]|uniref:pseudouridine synthase n=1 Tax=uncultured Rhodoblastus sp. TaxID=543037 RepID=UPI0025E89074|nr:pseudouridine synthase [uncultured Rhodoblastus sp.]